MAGLLFGSLTGIAAALFASEPALLCAGPALGFFLSSWVGMLVVLHLGTLCWIFWLHRWPRTVATLAGALTGAISSGFIWFVAPIAIVFGALGALIGARNYINTRTPSDEYESCREMQFTITDLMARMTVIAFFIAGWTGIVRLLDF